jgi:hypothetical protein
MTSLLIDLVGCVVGFITSIIFTAYVLYMASPDQLSYIMCFSFGVALLLLSVYGFKTMQSRYTILTKCQE